MDETHTSLFRRGRIIGICAEQDAIFSGVCLSKQTAGFGGGGTVESPIEQEQIRRRIRQ